MDVSPDGLVFKGSDRSLPDEDTPVDSPAARRIAVPGCHASGFIALVAPLVAVPILVVLLVVVLVKYRKK